MNRLARLCGTLGALAIGVLATPTVSAAEYRWLNSWDKTIPHISLLIEPYQKAVEAASKGSIKFIVSGPETVPAFEQLQPVASGAFQFLNTHGAYHFGTTPLLAVIEAIGGTPEQRRSSGLFELVDKYYQRLGLKIIAMPMGPDGGYQIILRQPLTANGDLAGRKIIADEEKELVAKGLTIVQMNDSSRAKLKQAWSDGLWEIAGQKAKKEVDELRALAKSKGLD